MSVTVKRNNPNGIMSVYERMGEKTKKEVAVGFPEGTGRSYPDGTPVLEVAARHVFGVGVPRRDFMALARQQIVEKTAPIIQAALSSDDPEPLMAAAGQAGQAAIQNAIVSLDDPPNAPETIKAKKSSNPLINTSHMKNSVTYVVRKRTR